MLISGNKSDCPQTIPKKIDFPGASDVEPEIIQNFSGQVGNKQNEDCLKLNVWSKATPESKKAVLVWFHGGRKFESNPQKRKGHASNYGMIGFSIGSTNNKYYQGQYLADKEDVIVVTVKFVLSHFRTQQLA